MDSQNFSLLKFAKTLLFDDEGFVITIELILIATIVGIGSIVGLTTLRDAINSEMADVADAIENMDWGNGNSNGNNGNGNNGNGNNGNSNSCITFSTPPTNEA